MLRGGVANRGQVVRVGPHVLRPSNPHSQSIFAFLREMRTTGFGGVPQPVGIDPDGRERLEYVEGEAPAAPYPSWALTDEALTSVAELMARFHRASAAFDPTRPGLTWNDEIADSGAAPSCATTTSASRTSCSAKAWPSRWSTSTSAHPAAPSTTWRNSPG